jgi:hypothetical protein
MPELWEALCDLLHEGWLDHARYRHLQLDKFGCPFQTMEQHVKIE